jgi:CRP-like cAMP-binding protein
MCLQVENLYGTTLTHLYSGQFFGDLGLQFDENLLRTATMVCCRPTTLLKLSAEDYAESGLKDQQASYLADQVRQSKSFHMAILTGQNEMK